MRLLDEGHGEGRGVAYPVMVVHCGEGGSSGRARLAA